MTTNGQQFLCVYGHFYQPPREDPFTNVIPREPGAGKYANFNEKITDECYRPNAEAGNFERISFNLGPTLAAWLERAQPDVYANIIEADRLHVARYGVGNALAQAYNHTILPLATTRDKRTQIRWGMADFAHRFGRPAEGMWLAETAVDLETLDLMAEAGLRYTVLAPWQAAEPLDPTEPYLVRLPSGREITVFFYNGPLSGAVSFDWDTTSDADTFAPNALSRHANAAKRERGEDQLIVIATDGELYGHHKAFRDRFLQRLLDHAAQAHGFEPITLGRYLRLHPPTRYTQLATPSSWSCGHGVARWSAGCSCTEGDSSWKPGLRRAFDHLGARMSDVFERQTQGALRDHWAARDDYLALRSGWLTADAFWGKHSARWRVFRNREQEANALLLLEAQYATQCMFTSCGFFFEDLDRIEPRNDIAYGRRAISLVWRAVGEDLQQGFLADLAASRSARTGVTAAEIYRRLPPREPDDLPPARDERADDESAA